MEESKKDTTGKHVTTSGGGSGRPGTNVHGKVVLGKVEELGPCLQGRNKGPSRQLSQNHGGYRRLRGKRIQLGHEDHGDVFGGEDVH